MGNPNEGADAKESAATGPAGLTCGLIMPISPMDGYSAEHWVEVKDIIIEAVESIREPQFTPRMVSDADDVGVIQKRIIQNVYNSNIVICDVSGKNSNVMFELGLRLAFDKPTVIVKDDKTGYSFDTGVIEHLEYPRDLRFGKIVEFKRKLADKVRSTYKASVEDPTHSPFLKSFGQFHVASLNQTEASPDKIMLEMLTDMQRDMQVLKRRLGDGRSLWPVSSQANEAISDFIQGAVEESLKNLPPMQLLGHAGFHSYLSKELQQRFGAFIDPSALWGLVGVALERIPSPLRAQHSALPAHLTNPEANPWTKPSPPQPGTNAATGSGRYRPAAPSNKSTDPKGPAE